MLNEERSAQASADKRHRKVGRVVDGGLKEAVQRSGGELLGFSVKYNGYDCLMTLRAEFPGGRMVAFVGASTLPSAMIRAWQDGNQDGLRWREDKFAR